MVSETVFPRYGPKSIFIKLPKQFGLQPLPETPGRVLVSVPRKSVAGNVK
jgi:hypothetical protein